MRLGEYRWTVLGLALGLRPRSLSIVWYFEVLFYSLNRAVSGAFACGGEGLEIVQEVDLLTSLEIL